MMKWILPLSFILAAPGAFAEKCDIDKLTNNCKVFDPKNQYVTLKNGKKVINYSYDSGEKDEKPEGPSEKERLEQLKNKARVLELLSKPKKKVSESFKLQMLSEIDGINYALAGQADKELRVPVYYPPESTNGTLKSMSAEEIQSLFKTYYSPQQVKELGALAGPPPGDDGAGSELNPVYKEQKQLTTEKQIADMMRFAKESMVKTILAGRKKEELSSAEKDALKKVESVNYHIGAEASDPSACSGVTPNAFYQPSTHQISICPNFLFLPPDAVMSVLGHELAHSIDPCLCQFGLYDVDKSRARAVLKSLNKSKPEDRENYEALQYILSEAGEKLNSSGIFQTAKNPEKLLKDLEAKGVLKKEIPEREYQEFPFSGVAQCLTNQNFRSTTGEREKYFKSLRDSGSISEKDVAQLEGAFKKHPECLPLKGESSQLGEAFADWFGTQVSSEYLAKKTKADADPLEPILFFANAYCASKANASRERSVGEQLARLESDRTASHPADRKRLEEIYLRSPDIAKTVGCSPGGPQCKHTPGSATPDKTPEVVR